VTFDLTFSLRVLWLRKTLKFRGACSNLPPLEE